MKNTVKVKIQNVYGQSLIYPINPQAVEFTKLTGKKTLSRSDLAIIKTLSFDVEVMTPSL